jgi:hypothetical protein
MSWISLQDLCRPITMSFGNDSSNGPVNAVSLSPATNAEFTKALSSALHRPAFVAVPAFGMRLAFGEMQMPSCLQARVSCRPGCRHQAFCLKIGDPADFKAHCEQQRVKALNNMRLLTLKNEQ